MLFDINLPGDWDGIKLLKTIRKKYPEYQKIPFIAQTAYAMAGDKERLLKEGFDSYLAKPIDKNELITTIKQQLSIYG
jgi:CheY-like chemotaxis protein